MTDLDGGVRKEAAEHLIELLLDNDEGVRKSTEKALTKITEQRLDEYLSKALVDNDDQVHCLVIDALSLINMDVTVDMFIRALHDKNGDLDRSASKALGQICDNRAVNPLIKLFLMMIPILLNQR